MSKLVQESRASRNPSENAMPEDIRFVARREPYVRVIDGEAVFYDPAMHEAVYFNAPAYAVWRHFDEPRTVREVSLALARELGVPVNQARVHASNALAAMQRHGWVARITQE